MADGAPGGVRRRAGEYDLYDGGKYQNNTGIQPSMLYKDFEKDME